AFTGAGDQIWLLGENRDELDGSAWAQVVHDHLGGRAPTLDLDHERRLAEVMATAARRQLLSSAHDLSDGGLAQAVVEAMLRHGHGARICLPSIDATAALFGESTGRVLVSLPPASQDAFGRLCEEQQVRAQHL